jgi:hypothetical protein
LPAPEDRQPKVDIRTIVNLRVTHGGVSRPQVILRADLTAEQVYAAVAAGGSAAGAPGGLGLTPERAEQLLDAEFTAVKASRQAG